jgi:cytochrome oxidase Cu insertion factor (SCO1/SenC/PrrC family)
MRAMLGASQVMLAVFVSFQGCGKAIRERLAGRPTGDPAVGQLAPEIQGEDTSGEPFKLSDFRGKVVVLNFWGDW